MPRLASLLALCLLCVTATAARAEDLPPIPPIKRLLPPLGIEIPADVRKELETKLAELSPRIARLSDDKQHRPDVEVFTKAVAYALRFGEFYDKKDFDKARWALQQAEERLALAEKNEFPWLRQTGLVVRGYRSSIDESVQPYGVVIPKSYDFSRRSHAFIWLHGRGDKQTDLHFAYERAHRPGEVAPPDAIVVHPFGRHCLGFKSAGEIDVLDTTFHACDDYNLDRRRIVLMGFSMGGAGAWHLGAHYPNLWCAVSPGAGFAETARYQNLKPENYPPTYEQALWGTYDVPGYARNLFNLPVIAYSGENDKQIQAARVMEEAYRSHDRELTHLIGPGMGHKYHPDVLKDLVARLTKIAERPASEVPPQRAHLQTQTLQYNVAGWLVATSLESHWQDTRLDGQRDGEHFTITTKNVREFHIDLSGLESRQRKLTVDGQKLTVPLLAANAVPTLVVRRSDKQWTVQPWTLENTTALRKRPKLQGPIDHAFLDRFLVVLPTGRCAHPRVQQWLDFEVERLQERWPAAFRGELRVKRDVDVTADDLCCQHIVCFGDPRSNKIIRDTLPKLPVAWSATTLALAGREFDASTHVPLLVYPNPLAQHNYIVLNSGPTFREAHDRTNSLQNPKLPDWAIVDITTPPDGEKPGKIVAADFFDEAWQFK